jgi:hypothetical protein
MKSWTSPIFNERGKGNRPALQQQMKMIRDQRPSQAFGGCFGAKGSQATDEIVSIDIVLKNRTALNATTNNVVEGTRRIYAGLSRHGKIMSCHSKKQKRIFSWASPIFHHDKKKAVKMKILAAFLNGKMSIPTPFPCACT